MEAVRTSSARLARPHIQLMKSARERAQERFEKKMKRHEKAVRQVMNAHFVREGREALKVLRNAPGYVFQASSGLQGQLNDYMRVELRLVQRDGLNPTLLSRLRMTFLAAGVDFSRDAAVRFNTAWPGFPDESVAFIESRLPRLVDIVNDTSLRQINAIVKRGIEDGVGRDVIADRLRESFQDWTESRSMTIARTETGIIASQTEQDILARNPDRDQLLKIWLTARDERVRPSHSDQERLSDPQVGGIPVRMDAAFANGLKYPREWGGPAREVINCRCTLLYVKEDEVGGIAME